MKKKILSGLFTISIAAVVAFNVSMNMDKSELSLLVLANVEALASSEASPGDPCYKGSYNSSLPEATKCAQPCKKERCGGLTDKCY